MSLGVRLMAAAASLLAAAGLAAAQTPDHLVVTAYGGIWTQSVKRNFVPCFEAATHIPVDVLAGESANWLARIRASPQHPPIDVVTLAEADSLRAAREGLLDRITPAEVPNIRDIPDRFHKPWGDYAAVQNYGALGVIYNRSTIKDPPKDWKSLIDDVAAGRFGRRVAMPAGTYTWGPEFLWLLSQQYGGSMDVVFDRLKAAAPHVVKFWTTPVEALNLFATRQVDLMVYWDGRSYDFIGKSNPWAGFYIPAPTTIAGSVLVAKVKNAPPVAWQYVNCVLSTAGQLGHAETILYGVTNEHVVYPDSIKDKVTSADRITIPPYDQIIDKIPGWIERWDKEMR